MCAEPDGGANDPRNVALPIQVAGIDGFPTVHSTLPALSGTLTVRALAACKKLALSLPELPRRGSSAGGDQGPDGGNVRADGGAPNVALTEMFPGVGKTPIVGLTHSLPATEGTATEPTMETWGWEAPPDG